LKKAPRRKPKKNSRRPKKWRNKKENNILRLLAGPLCSQDSWKVVSSVFPMLFCFFLFSQTNLALHADDVANGVVYIYISQTTTSPSQPQKITL